MSPLVGKEALSAEEAERFAAASLNRSPPEPFALAAVHRTDGRARRCMVAAVRAGKGAEQRRVAETSPTPLAVVNGAEDVFIGHAFSDRVRYANLWRGRVHRIAGAGHAPFWERPEEFNALLAGFLDDVLGSR